jgi:hypothetical protein
MYWIDLDMDQWRALENVVMNIWVPSSWVGAQLAACQEGFSTMKLISSVSRRD